MKRKDLLVMLSKHIKAVIAYDKSNEVALDRLQILKRRVK